MSPTQSSACAPRRTRQVHCARTSSRRSSSRGAGQDVIVIESASPEVIYVPTYDPVQSTIPLPGVVAASLLTFGTAVAIGSCGTTITGTGVRASSIRRAGPAIRLSSRLGRQQQHQHRQRHQHRRTISTSATTCARGVPTAIAIVPVRAASRACGREPAEQPSGRGGALNRPGAGAALARRRRRRWRRIAGNRPAQIVRAARQRPGAAAVREVRQPGLGGNSPGARQAWRGAIAGGAAPSPTRKPRARSVRQNPARSRPAHSAASTPGGARSRRSAIVAGRASIAVRCRWAAGGSGTAGRASRPSGGGGGRMGGGGGGRGGRR